MTQAFMIPGRLAGLNDFIGAANSNRHKYNALKRTEQDRVILFCRTSGIKPVDKTINLVIVCYEPNMKRDKSNVRSGAEKIIEDALQDAGIIRNDNWAGIAETRTRVMLDRDNPRVIVYIEEVDGLVQT